MRGGGAGERGEKMGERRGERGEGRGERGEGRGERGDDIGIENMVNKAIVWQVQNVEKLHCAFSTTIYDNDKYKCFLNINAYSDSVEYLP